MTVNLVMLTYFGFEESDVDQVSYESCANCAPVPSKREISRVSKAEDTSRNHKKIPDIHDTNNNNGSRIM